MQRHILRLIDANYNRSLEGLRVCEDISRFILNDKILTAQFKNIRHRITKNIKSLPISLTQILKYRDIEKDVGKKTNILEIKRNSIKDIFFINFQRSKESLRVLEEFSKLLRPAIAESFKRTRYFIYGLEKKTARKF